MTLLPLDADERLYAVRLALVPALSTLGGSAVALLPIVASTPALPPAGLLMLLAWRLLRDDVWVSWAGLPLGLADDLLSGNPPGTAAATWTALLLALDLIDRRVAWRDHWLDWLLASAAIAACLLVQWLLAGFVSAHGSIAAAAQQAGIAILCYPAAVRIAAFLDRWRLSR